MVQNDDPRIRRTRQLLLDALGRLLEAKDIDAITVADIAAASTVNRATFYDHYSDKFDLLEGLIEAKFQQLLADRNVVFDGACSSALRGISLAACDYMASHGQMGKHYEEAISAVIRNMILGGLKQHPTQNSFPPELIAAMASGAICSGAREWARTPVGVSAEEAAAEIFALVRPMLELTAAGTRAATEA